jgi:hypothetical protein
MRADKKQARENARIAALAAAAYGIKAPEVMTGPSAATRRDNISREAEAVLAYKENPEAFTERTCTHCGKRFAVNRARVANCSVECVAKELEGIGIKFDWSKPPEQRWGLRYREDKLQDEPLIITEQPLDLIQQLLGNVRQTLGELSPVNTSNEIIQIAGF